MTVSTNCDASIIHKIARLWSISSFFSLHADIHETNIAKYKAYLMIPALWSSIIYHIFVICVFYSKLSTFSTAYTVLNKLSIATSLLSRPVLPSPPWFRLDARGVNFSTVAWSMFRVKILINSTWIYLISSNSSEINILKPGRIDRMIKIQIWWRILLDLNKCLDLIRNFIKFG